MKAIMLSFKPENAREILNGNKKLELRKRVPKGFVGWVYGYVTKGKPLLARYDAQVVFDGKWIDSDYLYEFTKKDDERVSHFVNGTIPFRFWFDEYEELFFVDSEDDYKLTYDYGIYYDYDEDIFKKLCLKKIDVYNYGKGKDVYAWHINKLEVFDKPMVLGDFKIQTSNEVCGVSKRPPQSYQYVWVKEVLK